MYKKILVPLDGSTLAEKALPHAIELARNGKGKIILLRCIPPPEPLFAAADMSYNTYYAEAQQAQRGHSEGYLSQLAERPDLAGLVESVRVPCGHPADEILDFALAEKVDLVVISSHGRTGLGRFVFGSVAERVVRHSPCPVMVVAAEHAAPEAACA